ncbi:hypothetical protein [Nocardia higoensis]|uniref:hypothetical protein n=1 Tax=Nocardia higoensis TaxID=228599 RepID=UPI0012F6E11D|nr:hypothetical protein [Nocardia higoensis]
MTGLLDYGSKMLLYFEEFHPLYARAFPKKVGIKSYEELHARYYEQNGMDEGALVDAFEAVSAAAAAMTKEHGVQQTISQSISQAWQGDAASAALDMISTQLRLADDDAAAARNIAATLESAPTALRAAVKIKSDRVSAIMEDMEIKFDGKSPDDVLAIIAGSEGIGLSSGWHDGTLVSKIRRIFPDMEEGFADGMTTLTNTLFFGTWVVGGTPYADMVKKRCQDWLDAVFAPDYPKKVDKFVEACDLTHGKVIETYSAITNALKALKTDPYPQPDVVPSQKNPSGETPSPAGETPSTNPSNTSTPSSTDTPTTPASSPAGTPTGTDTDDDSTNPAGTSNPLSGLTNLSQIADQLSPVLTSLTESVQTALTALSTTVDEEIDKALENLKNLTGAENDPADDTGGDEDGDGKPDGEVEPLAEFDLAGKEVTFEQGEDGLKMVLTDSDGKTTEYRMTIDENGVPLVSAVDGEPTGGGEGGQTPAEGTPAGAPAAGEQPASSTSVPSAPAPGKREEDGEYIPTPIPAPELTEDEAEPVAEPEAPAVPVADEPPVGDTGAVLAEAGPL